MSDAESITYEELPTESIKKQTSIKNMNLLYNIPIKLKAKLGGTMLTVEEILQLDIDCIVELDTSVGDLVEIYANEVLIGHGEIVVVNEDIGIKIVKIISTAIDEFLIP